MMHWLNSEKIVFGVSLLVFALIVTNAQRNWLTGGGAESGRDSLAGSSADSGSEDSMRLDQLDPDFSRYSLLEGRNVFEPLDKMLPMPPVHLELPELPAAGMLAPMVLPTPPSAGHEICRLVSSQLPPLPQPSSADEAVTEEADPFTFLDETGEDEGDGEPGDVEGEPDGDPDGDEETAAEVIDPRWQDPRVRVHATLELTSGATVAGTIMRETRDAILMELPGEDRVRRNYQRRDIANIIPALSLAEVVDGDLSAIRPGDDAGYLKLFDRWLDPATPPELLHVVEAWAMSVSCDSGRTTELYQRLSAHFRARVDLDRELAVLECARRQTGDFTPIQLLAELADVTIRIGLPARARSLLEQALLRKRNDENLRLLLARLQIDAGNLEQARSLLDQLGAAALARPEVASLYARAEYLAGDFQSAHDHLTAIIDQSSESRLHALLLDGAALTALGQLEVARNNFTTILDLLADAPPEENSEILGLAWYDLGVLSTLEGDSSAALTAFETAIASDPMNAWPHLGIGFLYEAGGDLARARESYERALAVQPGLGYGELAIGRLAEAEASGDPGRLAEARRHYQLAFVSDFELTDAVARLGYLAADIGRRGGGAEHFYEALDFLGEAARRTPMNLQLRLEVAHCHLALGELKPAEEIFERIRAEHPENADALAGLAYVKNAAGEELRARAYLGELASRSALSGALSTFATDGLTAIERNLARWRWVDTFNRGGAQTTDDPRREWVTVQQVGVRVYLDEKTQAVQFEGTQASDAPDVPTRLEREISPGRFAGFKAKIDTSKAEKAVAVLSMRFVDEKRPTELQWGKNGDEKLAWRLINRGVATEWNVIADFPSSGVHELELRVETGTGKQRFFLLALDGVVLRGEDGRIKSTQLSSTGSKGIRVGVSASAPAYKDYSLIVDDVELVEVRPR